MKKIELSDKTASLVAGCISLGLFILIWFIGTSTTELGKLIPGPLLVFTAVVEGTLGSIGRHSLLVHAAYSLARILVGYVIGATLGCVLGLTMGWYPAVAAIFQPLFRIIRPIPPIAWIPIAILWFGLGESSKIFLIFLSSFSNVTLNAWAGVQSVDKELIGAAKMLGASDRKIFFTVVMPSSVPQIFAGLQVAMSACWATVLAAEMVRSSEGLGWMIIAGMESNNIVQILTGIVGIGVVGFGLAVLMRKLEDTLCRWNKSGV